MSWIDGLTARARSILAPRASDSRMEEEFRFHVEMETARLVAEGVPRVEAQRRARLAFGGMDAHREAMRDGRGARWLTDMGADMRYALRSIRHSPGFAIAVALTLGIGIGVNGIVFGWVNSLVLRPVPAHDPQRLVALFNVDTRSGLAGELGYDDYVDFRDRSGIFDGLAGMTGVPLNLAINSSAGASAMADVVWGEMVTENFFSVLGMRPTLGRFFTAPDAPQGANAFAVLSYDAWQRRFEADPHVIGRVVRLNGHPFTIVAVAARGFNGMRRLGFWPELWVPVGMHDIVAPGSARLLQGRGGGWMMVFGRMRAGWSVERTASAVALFAKQLATAYPQSNQQTGAAVLPAGVGFELPSFVTPAVLVLSSVLGMFGSLLTLLIICANLANLQLARVSARAREIGIRLALGCSRGRLIRQLLVESIVCTLPGAVLALGVLALSPALQSRLEPHMQFRGGFPAAQPDARSIAFTAMIALLAAMLFGLIPALRAARKNIAPTLARVVGAPRPTPRGPRLRSMLVVGQLAAAVVLLVGGMLFARSLASARASDLGFDPSNRLIASVNLGLQGYDDTRGQRFYDDVITRVRALPDVVAATWGFPVPFDTYEQNIPIWIDGARGTSKTDTLSVPTTNVADDFVRAMGLGLEAGRAFAASDSAGTPDVMMISRSLATRLWPGQDAIGRQVRLGGASGQQVTVIGVVADATFATLGTTTASHAYVPIRQHYIGRETLIVHTRGEPALVLPQLRAIVAAADPALPLFDATTMNEGVESGVNPWKTAALVAGFFAALALVIAAVGLYAVVASGVTERTREIGVRLALGATPGGVLRLVMHGSMRLGAWGLAIGLVASLGAARALGALLYGVSSADPLTFAAVPIVLALVVVMATYVPARRAVGLDPVAALRHD
jgi:predicted permease